MEKSNAIFIDQGGTLIFYDGLFSHEIIGANQFLENDKNPEKGIAFSTKRNINS